MGGEGGGAYFQGSAMPHRKGAGPLALPNIGVPFYFCVEPLTKNDEIWHGTTYEEGARCRPPPPHRPSTADHPGVCVVCVAITTASSAVQTGRSLRFECFACLSLQPICSSLNFCGAWFFSVVLVSLSVPVQVIDWKDSSPK